MHDDVINANNVVNMCCLNGRQLPRSTTIYNRDKRALTHRSPLPLSALLPVASLCLCVFVFVLVSRLVIYLALCKEIHLTVRYNVNSSRCQFG